MKKNIIIILSITFVVLSITACEYTKTKFPRVYAYFNKMYGFDDNGYYYNNNEKTYYQMSMEQNSLETNQKLANNRDGTHIKGEIENGSYNSQEDENEVSAEKVQSLKKNNIKEQRFIKSKYKNFGIIISGPSGVGKTTIINALKQKHTDGEIYARDYYFLDIDMFKKLLAGGEFLEYANNYGNYYGTPKRNYFDAVDNGKDVIFALSISGMQNAIQHDGMDFVTIFIAPPSYDVLKQRLVDRHTETEAQINKRLSSARKEISMADGLYNYVVYNYNLDNTIDVVEAIYFAEQRKREIMTLEREGD